MSVHLTLRNYRCFRRADWSPPDVSLLVGPNGSGKSTLLSTFDVLRNVYLRSLSTALYFEGGAAGLRNLLAPEDEPVQLVLTVGNTSWELTPGLKGLAADGELGEVVREGSQVILQRSLYSGQFVFRGDNMSCGETCALRKAFEMTEDPTLKPLVHALTTFRVYGDYRLYQLRQQGSRMDSNLYLSRGGENLFTVLRNWRDKRELRASYEVVLNGLREAFPDLFDDLEFELAGQTVTASLYLHKLPQPMPVVFAPDGLLVAFLHLTAVAGAQPGTLVGIDEMENALHPYAIRALTRAIRQLAQERNLQIVLTTHSPVLLDEFKNVPCHVFVLEANQERVPMPLDEQRDPEWLAHFSLGELFSEFEFGAPLAAQREKG